MACYLLWTSPVLRERIERKTLAGLDEYPPLAATL
jgi:hypothetical protein